MDCAWNKGVATRGILMDHIRYHTTRSSKWIKPAAPFSKGIPCSLVQYLSDFLGGRKRYLLQSTPPPTPTPSRRPPWTSCQRRPDGLVPGCIRYRTYLCIMIRQMETGIGTPEYTDRYILFEGGWEGTFFKEALWVSVGTHTNEFPGWLQTGARHHFQIRAEQRCIHWKKEILKRHIFKYYTARSSKWIKLKSSILVRNPAPSRTCTWAIFGAEKRVLNTKYFPPPTPTPSRRPPWTHCHRRPDWLVPATLRYRTYLFHEYKNMYLV